jgi:hypothetical protein
MAILYGTTGDGTTLPVLVDQFGNLLAKGIDGQPGQPGQDGAPGLPGPPGADGGDFPLPPDPYEGAFLGWLNNGLAWISTPPVPIPEGVFGPITSWSPSTTLIVDGEIPPQVAQGVYVYQCNQNGTIYVDGWNNSQKWSENTTGSSSGSGPEYTWDKAFNGELYVIPGASGGTDNDPSSYTCSFTPIQSVQSLVVTTVTTQALPGSFQVSDASGNVRVVQSSDVIGGSPQGWELDPSIFTSISGFGVARNIQISGIKVNGELLVDSGEYPTAPNLAFLVQSVSGQTLTGLGNRTDDFTIGKYLRVPQQNMVR